MEQNDVGKVVVIDNGTGYIKAGFNGDAHPRLCFPNVIGVPKHEKNAKGIIGHEAVKNRENLILTHPMTHGTVETWEEMEDVWKYCFEQLETPIEGQATMIADSINSPLYDREKTLEFYFETLEARKLKIEKQPLLSLYSTGKTTGVVVESGEGLTSVSCIWSGYLLPHTNVICDTEGNDITKELSSLLTESGQKVDFYSAEMIKENVCYISEDVNQETYEVEDNGNEFVDFKLPDGQVIKVGKERFLFPEGIFDPHAIGINDDGVHQTLQKSVMKADVDIRGDLLGNIVLAGGNTLFKGYQKRLENEIKMLFPAIWKQEFASLDDRRNSAFIGGAIVSNLESYHEEEFITLNDFWDHGVNILRRRG